MQLEQLAAEPWALPLVEGPHVGTRGGPAWLIGRLRSPRPRVRAELRARGFVFQDDVQGGVLRNILGDSNRLLANVPRLQDAVQRAVAEVVLLRSPLAFDISHSEPRWPQTIFISVPCRRGEINALRAAENIVHEAMHLQLTMLEQARPLVADKMAKLVSPWRKELRPLRGVLHGLYVFHCISAFFAVPRLLDKLGSAGTSHVARRRVEIADEISQIDFANLASGMTSDGLDFLFALVGDPAAPRVW